MPYATIQQATKSFPSSTFAQNMSTRYAAFENKRSLLAQKKNSLERERARIEAEEKRLDGAKRKLDFQRNRLDIEKAREELRLFEEVFEKAMREVVRIADAYLEGAEKERVLRGVENRVRCVVREVEMEKDKRASGKRVRFNEVNGIGCGLGGQPVSKGEQKVKVPSGVKVEQKAEVTVPQKRSAACAGFRQAYVESEDDSEYGF